MKNIIKKNEKSHQTLLWEKNNNKKTSSWLKDIYQQRFMMLVVMFWYKGQNETVYQIRNFGM